MNKQLLKTVVLLLFFLSIGQIFDARAQLIEGVTFWPCTEVTPRLFADHDHDGEGSPLPVGERDCPECVWENCATRVGDCNDEDPDINSSTVYYYDADGDGYYTETWKYHESFSATCPQSNLYRVAGKSRIEIHHVFFGDIDKVYQPIKLGDCDDNNYFVNTDTDWYLDKDKDGYWTSTKKGCKPGADWHCYGETVNGPNGQFYQQFGSGDCDDNNPNGYGPMRTVYIDHDGDKRGVGAPTQSCMGGLNGYVESSAYLGPDADDNNYLVWKSANLYQDKDGDGYSTGPYFMSYGDNLPSGYSLDAKNGTDCDDNAKVIWKMGLAYIDKDEDGYSDGDNTGTVCLGSTGYNPPGYVMKERRLGIDCDDNNPNIYESHTYYKDNDGDWYDDGTIVRCAGFDMPPGYQSFTLGKDCNDNDNNVTAVNTYYKDSDGDGYDDGSITRCSGGTPPQGYIRNTRGKDCDDNNNNRWHTGTYYVDADGDGRPGNKTPVYFCNTFPAPAGYTYASSNYPIDCDDNNGNVYSSMPVYVDNDGDGWNDGSGPQTMCAGSQLPTGYTTLNYGVDCNDNNSRIFPGGPEQPTWWKDLDGDGFGNPTITLKQSCKPDGYVQGNMGAWYLYEDCNDNNSAIKPNTVWYKDADNDGYSDGATITQCPQPGGYKLSGNLTAISGDCRDNDVLIYPGSVKQSLWFRDNDNDGFGDAANRQISCAQPSGYVSDSTDCDDANNAIKLTAWYKDNDNDGHGDGIAIHQCASPGAGYKTSTQLSSLALDCNDNNSGIYPVKPAPNQNLSYFIDGDNDSWPAAGAEYVAFGDRPYTWYPGCEWKLPDQTGVNQYLWDCVDNDPEVTFANNIWYKDADNDGYTDGVTFKPSPWSYDQCGSPGAGWKRKVSLISTQNDCNDNNAAIYPGSNPSGLVRYFRDADGDGFGNVATKYTSCIAIAGYVVDSTDCDDANAQINPNTIWYTDSDNDGFGNAAITIVSCAKPSGYVSNKLDCNDNNNQVNPSIAWYKDADNDGYSDGNTIYNCTRPFSNYKSASELVSAETVIEPYDPSLGVALNFNQVNSNYVSVPDNDNSLDLTSEFSIEAWINPSDGSNNTIVDKGNYQYLFQHNPGINGLGIYRNGSWVFGYMNIPLNAWSHVAVTYSASGNAVKFYLNGVQVGGTYSGAVNTAPDNGDLNIGRQQPSDCRCNYFNGSMDELRLWNHALSATEIKNNYNKEIPGAAQGLVANFHFNQGVAGGNNTSVSTLPDASTYNNNGTLNGFSKNGATSNFVSPGGVNGTTTLGDCNDNDAFYNTTTLWYKDADNDGYSDGTTKHQCSQPTGYKLTANLTAISGDCNDNNELVKPTTVWYQDSDGDGYGNSAVSQITCVKPTGYVLDNTDCNDNNVLVNPATVWYQDLDHDGYGNASVSQNVCAQPNGYVLSNTDCNDNDSILAPTTVWFKDKDNDAYGSGDSLIQCSQPTDYKLKTDLIATKGDCNDTNAAINPTLVWYKDADHDGYSDGTTLAQCTRPNNYKSPADLIATSGDCNDADSTQYPGVVWYKDVDNDGYSDGVTLTQCDKPVNFKIASNLTALSGDCKDSIAAQTPTTIWYRDVDNDGYSDGNTIIQCEQPVNYRLASDMIALSGDCDDSNENIFPTTVWFKDEDNDGYSNGDSLMDCNQPANYKLAINLTSTSGDCNDNDSTEQPGAVWYKDVDNDGYSDGISLVQCVKPVNYKTASSLTAISGDCKDSNAVYNPITVWYKDADNDGYSDGTTQVQCTQPGGYKLSSSLTATSGDCNDADAVINPTTVWYRDVDNDGFSDGTTLTQCPQPANYKLLTNLTGTSDCNDNDALAHETIPTVSITGSNLICATGQVSFTATHSGSATFHYQWEVNGTNQGTDNVVFSTSSLNYGNNVSCVLTSPSYCSSATSNTLVQTMNPIVSVSATADGCIEDATLSVDNGNQVTSIEWKLNGTSIDTATYGGSVQLDSIMVSYGGFSFNSQYLTQDGAGNIYVSDYENSRVLRWRAGTGLVQIVAGGNGNGNAANQLFFPQGIAVDTQENLYIVDMVNSRLQKWAPDATSGTTIDLGSDVIYGGDIELDRSGNLIYSSGYKVFRLNLSSGSKTLIYTSTTTSHNFYVDKDDNLFICEKGNHQVIKIPYGETSPVLVAGGNGFGNAQNQLKNPLGISVDGGGNIFIADEGNSRVQKWEPGAISGTTYAAIEWPTDLFINSNDKLFILNAYQNTIKRYNISVDRKHKPQTTGDYSAIVKDFNGCSTTSNTVTIHPMPTWYKDKDGDGYATGEFITQCAKPTDYRRADSLIALAGDCNDNDPNAHEAVPNIKISSSQLSCASGGITFTAEVIGSGDLHYQWKVNGTNAGADNSVFPSSSLIGGNSIQCILTSNGHCSDSSNVLSQTIAPTTSLSTSDLCQAKTVLNVANINSDIVSVNWKRNNETVEVAQIGVEDTIIPAGSHFSSPHSIAMDQDGNIYVADTYNHRIQKWQPGATSGITVAGGNGQGNADNQLDSPKDLALDKQGNIYVADLMNNRFQKWQPDALSGTTVATPQFGHPYGPIIDDNNNLIYSNSFQIIKHDLSNGDETVLCLTPSYGYQNLYLDKHYNIYLADFDAVYRLDSGATSPVLVAGGNGPGSGANQFAMEGAEGLAVDERDGSLLIVDRGYDRIQKWMPGADSGTTVLSFSHAYPQDISIGEDGKAYVFFEDGADYISANGGWLLKYALHVDSTFKPLAAGQYSAVVTNKFGCSTTSNSLTINPTPVWYKDADGDLMGAYGSDSLTCGAQPPGYVSNNYDCDDANPQASNPQAEITVKGNSISIVAGDHTPDTYDFTNMGLICAADASSISKTFTIENPGTEDLTISSAAVSGEQAAFFTLSAVPSVVPAGGSSSFIVTYNPSEAIGLHNARITVNNNDCNESAYEFSISASKYNKPSVDINASGTFVCEGKSVTLKGSGAENYTWTRGVMDGEAFVPSSTATYTVSGTNGYGCSSTDVIQVVVNPLPVVASTISPESGTLCSGTEITLKGEGAASYSWTGINHNPIDGEAFAVSATSTYTLVGTDVNGCTNTITRHVIVNPNHAPTLSIAFESTGGATTCIGDSVSLIASGNALNYSWSEGIQDGVPFAPSTSKTYVLTGTNMEGCSNTASYYAEVKEFSKPILSSTLYPDLGVICNGSSIILKGEGAVSYFWTTAEGTGPVDGQAFVTNSSTIYTLVGMDENGCSNTIVRAVNVIPFTASAININVSPATTVCAGATVNLNATGASNYLWSNGVINAVDFVADSTATYIVIGTDDNGCQNSSSQKIVVNALPSPFSYSVYPDRGAVCPGGMVRLFAETDDQSGNLSFAWSGGVTDGLGFFPDSSSFYTLTCTNNNNGCKDSLTTYMTLLNRPSVYATSSSPLNSFCSGSEVTLKGQGARTYSWSGGIQNGVPFNASQSDTYVVEGTDIYGCTNKDTIEVTINSTNSNNTLNVSTCSGYTFAGQYLETSGTYYDTVPNFTGCDSIITLYLTINNNAGSEMSEVAYISYAFAGNPLNVSGTYVNNLQDHNGCDSIVTLYLTITNLAGDKNGDGLIDNGEIAGDINGDGAINNGEVAGDKNGDGTTEGSELSGDINGNGLIDAGELGGDKNGNGSFETGEIAGDINNDGTIGAGETAGDTNGNGIIDGVEVAGDNNGDGKLNAGEIFGDKNGDGVIDNNEIAGDVNADNTIENGELAGDTNGNGFIDGNEIAGDINGDGNISGDEIAGDVNGDASVELGEIAGDGNGNGDVGTSEIAGDADGDGSIDFGEIAGDSDGDGTIGNGEHTGDKDGDGNIANGEVAGDSDGSAPTPGNISFTNGNSQSLEICQNAGDISINALLAATNDKAGETLSWTVVSGPSHGTVNLDGTSTSSVGSVIPSGKTYTPSNGYAGNDTIVIINNNGAMSTATKISIVMNELPEITISGSTSICVGESVSLTASASGGKAASYLWSTGENVATITKSPTVNTTYSVTGTSNACSVTAARTVNIETCTGIEEALTDAGNPEINIYPNPTSGNVILSFTLTYASHVLTRITDMHGKILHSNVRNQYAGKYLESIDLSAEAKGVYFLTVTTNLGVTTKKIVLQ